VREIWVAEKLLAFHERPLRAVSLYFKVINLFIVNNLMDATEKVPWMMGKTEF
jgi:hypothetical protein